MAVNWKDLCLTYITGWALIILITMGIAAAVLSEIPILSDSQALPQIIFIILYGIPLAFYFFRNKTRPREGAVISFACGATLTPFFLFSVFLFYKIVFFILQTNYSLNISDVNWAFMITELLFNGTLVLIYGLFLWFVIKEVHHDKEYRESREEILTDYKNFLNSFGKPKDIKKKR